MYIGYETIIVCCALAAFVLACRAIALSCFARKADGATSRLALFWCAVSLILSVGVPAFDRFAASWQAACASCALLTAACLAAWGLGRRWREQAMEREAQRFAAECYYALQEGAAQAAETDNAPDYVLACAQAARAYNLTRREEDVLLLLIQGKTALEVSDDLVVSPNTVKTHIRNLYRKLGINRRADLSRRLNCEEVNATRPVL